MKNMLKTLIFTGVAGAALMGANVTQVSAASVLDSDGDPVITGEHYTIELKTNGYGGAYFTTDTELDDHWLAPSADIEKNVHFSLSRGDESEPKEVQEGRRYNMYTEGGTENGFLTYQSPGLFYPHGGAYIQGDRSDSMAITFNADTDGYYHNDMNLLYRSGMQDIVASGDGGHPFVVKFIKNAS